MNDFIFTKHHHTAHIHSSIAQQRQPKQRSQIPFGLSMLEARTTEQSYKNRNLPTIIMHLLSSSIHQSPPASNLLPNQSPQIPPMAFSIAKPNLYLLPILITCLFFLLQLHKVKSSDSVCFTSTQFGEQVSDLILQGAATPDQGTLKLTATNSNGNPITNSVGRVLFSSPVHLWESSTGKEASFSTSFSFITKPPPSGGNIADGLTFFLAPQGTQIPSKIEGQYLGIFEPSTGQDPTKNQIVAVEFDTFKNGIDPPETPHLGIDINQIVSEVTAAWNTTNVPNGSTAFVRITYDAPTTKLSVTLSYPNVPNSFKSTLSHDVNLKSILPEWVVVGISGCSGLQVSLNNLLSWSFSSELKSISSSIDKKEM